MATDYLLFVHGVNTRIEGMQPNYADGLFALIKSKAGSRARNIEKIAVYWGDLNDEQESKLCAAYRASPLWNKFWFRQFRENLLLRFAGDTALYLSRYVGSKVADRIKGTALAGLKNYQKDDRLHFVTHSMGTVILFDMLFSARWDQKDIPGYESVAAFRDTIFGVSPNPLEGIRLGSITTMGSPIAIFSLMDVDQKMEDAKNAQGNVICTHDITPRLEKLLYSLYQELGTKLIWRNFAHPGDPIAYPLATLLPSMVDGESKYLDIQDVLTRPVGLSSFLASPNPVNQMLLMLLQGGDAHNSYWASQEVVQSLVDVMQKTAQVAGVSESIKI